MLHRLLTMLLLTGLLLQPTSVLARTYRDDGDKVVYPTVKTSHFLSRGLQTITGLNLLGSVVANRLVRREVAQLLDGDYSIRLSVFSLGDLLAAKARQLRFSGQNLLLDDFLPVQQLSFYSDKRTPLFVHKKHRVLMRPVTLYFDGVVSEDNLNRFLQSSTAKKWLSGIKIPTPPFKRRKKCDLLDPRAAIQDDGRVVVSALLNIQGAPRENGLPVTLSARLRPAQDTIRLADVKVNIEDVEHASALEPYIEQYFNQVVTLRKIRIKHHKVSLALDELQTRDHTLRASGSLLLRPDDKRTRQMRREIGG